LLDHGSDQAVELADDDSDGELCTPGYVISRPGRSGRQVIETDWGSHQK